MVNWRKIIGSRNRSVATQPYPESAGAREKVKFRESDFPGLAKVAISNDDGSALATAQVQRETLAVLNALLGEMQALRKDMTSD